MAIATGQGMGLARADDATPNPVSSEAGEQQGEDTGTTPSTDPAPISEQAPAADAKLDRSSRHVVDRLVPRMRINVSGGARIVGVHTDKKETQVAASDDPDIEKATGNTPDLATVVKDASQRGVSRRIDRQAGPLIKVDLPVVATAPIRTVPRAVRPQVRLQSLATVTAGPTIDLKPAATKQQITTAAVRLAPAVATTRPVAPLRAVATTALRVVNDALAAVWSPTAAAPAPGTPRAPQPILLAVLGWIRREFQTAVFNRTPQIAPQQTISLHLRKPTDVATIDLKELGAKDADGDVLTYSTPARGQTGGPTKGTVTVDKTTGVLTYDPDDTVKPGDKDTFTVTVSDANGPAHLHGLFGFLRPDAGHSATSTITVTISNKAPVGTADELAIDEDTKIGVDAQSTLNPLHNDSDPDGDPLTAVKVSDPSHGTLELNSDGSFTYAPEKDFNGEDSFTYTVADGFTKSEPVKVIITVKPVNDLPVTKADTYDTDEDKTLIVAIDKGVLANDSDIDEDVLTAVVETNPGKGAVALNGNGSFTYTPNLDENGDDAFSYTVKDGTGSSAPVTVNIHITPVNDAPVVEIGHFDVPAGTVITGDFLNYVTDVDKDHLTLVSVRTDHGTLDPIPDGTTAFVFHTLSDAAGTAAINYVISDGTVEVNGQIRIITRQVNRAPVANDDELIGRPGTSIAFEDVRLLANDTDADGDAKNILASSITQPANGSLTFDGQFFTYTPDADFHGVDTFTYRTTDGAESSNLATVKIAVNDPPVAKDDAATVPHGKDVSGSVLANDSDPNGDELRVILKQGPKFGSMVIIDNGQYSYKPNPGFAGTDEFTYTVSDKFGGSAVGKVTIAVTNTPPVANDDIETTAITAGAKFTAGVPGILANDRDPDGDGIYVKSVSALSNAGDYAYSEDGRFSFTPNLTFVGTAVFEYIVSDGFATDTGRIEIPVKAPPVGTTPGVPIGGPPTLPPVVPGPPPPIHPVPPINEQM
jgi:VCBS repeat-containing protein